MRTFGITLALALIITSAAEARTLAGQKFAEQVEVGGHTLKLNGVGMRLATIFNVKVYAAGLYLQSPNKDPGVILGRDEPWRLVMKFVRDVGEDDLKSKTAKGFDPKAPASMKAKVAQLTSAISGVKSGDVVTLSYVPGTGTTVKWGKGAAKVIKGADFGKALLRSWLGDKPPNKELKAGLLGG